MRIFPFLFFLSSLFFANAGHKFYVSVSDAVYNEESESIQIITRVFIDDFEDVINLRYGTSITLEEGTENSDEVEAFIDKYLRQKLKFEANGKEYPITYLGKQYDVDQLKLFIEVENIQPFTEIEVTNNVLTDLYDTQKNLFHLKLGKKTKSSVMMKDKSKALLKF
jgi:hypothetical protein